ncbi:MAG TPA: PilZ domain-containing protein [Terriglobales bacterium]|nr:PilZ domain-containing protein [Terriglobales bacterium]
MPRTDLERRQFTRYPHVLDVQAREVSPLLNAKMVHTVQGRIQNVSRGGLCILSSEPIGSPLVLCEIVLPEMPVSIPALLNVRWSEKREVAQDSYLSGLQFVF